MPTVKGARTVLGYAGPQLSGTSDGVHLAGVPGAGGGPQGP